VKALTTPHADIPGSHSKYGYGLELDGNVWSHAGSRAGYGSFVTILPERDAGVVVLCNRTGENLPKTRAKIAAMLGGSGHESSEEAESMIPASDFAKYVGTYRNGDSRMQIVEREGKLFLRSMELRRGDGGWLIMKSADGKTRERVFAISGPGGRIEYLYNGGRSAARID
jgi:CubicO group peptidase (beta-lactamase class C family)